MVVYARFYDGNRKNVSESELFAYGENDVFDNKSARKIRQKTKSWISKNSQQIKYAMKLTDYE